MNSNPPRPSLHDGPLIGEIRSLPGKRWEAQNMTHEVGIKKDETGVRWIVVGAPDSHHSDEGGSHNSRIAAEREARSRAKRCGGIYVGDIDRARSLGSEAAHDFDEPEGEKR